MKIKKFEDNDMSSHDIRSRMFVCLKDFGKYSGHIAVSL